MDRTRALKFATAAWLLLFLITVISGSEDLTFWTVLTGLALGAWLFLTYQDARQKRLTARKKASKVAAARKLAVLPEPDDLSASLKGVINDIFDSLDRGEELSGNEDFVAHMRWLHEELGSEQARRAAYQEAAEENREDENWRQNFRQAIKEQETFFRDGTNSITVDVGDFIRSRPSGERQGVIDSYAGAYQRSALDIGRQAGQPGAANMLAAAGSIVGSSVTAYRRSSMEVTMYGFKARRTLSTMDSGEQGVLKTLRVLNAGGAVSDEYLAEFERCVVFNSGNCTLVSGLEGEKVGDEGVAAERARAGVKSYLSQLLPSSGTMVDDAVDLINQLQADPPRPEIGQYIKQSLWAGQSWLTAADLEGQNVAYG